jgi:transposase
MAFQLLTEELWEQTEPHLTPVKEAGTAGRPPISNRQALTGILFVLHTGCPWRLLPAELGCGSGVTCWRRLREWTRAGVWARVHRRLLDHLGKAGKIRWARGVIDSASVRALLGGATAGPTPPTGPKKAANATA